VIISWLLYAFAVESGDRAGDALVEWNLLSPQALFVRSTPDSSVDCAFTGIPAGSGAPFSATQKVASNTLVKKTQIRAALVSPRHQKRTEPRPGTTLEAGVWVAGRKAPGEHCNCMEDVVEEGADALEKKSKRFL
jgi:hypothetical protein